MGNKLGRAVGSLRPAHAFRRFAGLVFCQFNELDRMMGAGVGGAGKGRGKMSSRGASARPRVRKISPLQAGPLQKTSHRVTHSSFVISSEPRRKGLGLVCRW